MVILNNIGTSKSKRCIMACTIFVIIILSGYWLKCQIGIGFFENYSLSKYIPFKYLVPNNVIADPLPGIILNDSFDSFVLFDNWTGLWMREKGKVIKTHDSYGLKNSRCLLIKSNTKKSWSCSYKKFIRVEEGDVFSFKVSAKLAGGKLSAFSCVAAYDEKKHVISLNYISEPIDITDEWVSVERTFVIPKEFSYIRFKLSGTGIGDVRFDDVIFKMLKM